MRYADGNDLVDRYDARVIADVVRDDNTSVPIADVPSHPRVMSALDDASGEFEISLVAGKRYSIKDLEGLSGNNLAMRKRIVCDIAMSYLLQRRASRKPEDAGAAAKLAERHLKRLRDGDVVFSLEPQEDAGLPTMPEMSLLDYQKNYGLRDRVKNYYPARRYRTG